MVVKIWYCPKHGQQTDKIIIGRNSTKNRCTVRIHDNLLCGEELTDGPKEN